VHGTVPARAGQSLAGHGTAISSPIASVELLRSFRVGRHRISEIRRLALAAIAV